MKTCFQTDSQGYFLATVDCPPNPEEEGKFWIPYGAYENAPPPVGPFEVAKRVGDSWAVVADYRGFVYWTPERTQHVITEAEIEPPANHLTVDPGPTSTQIADDLKREAQALLSKSDQTVVRCYEGGVPVPDAWKVYRADLRAIVSTGLGSLPNRPEYPAGT